MYSVQSPSVRCFIGAGKQLPLEATMLNRTLRRTSTVSGPSNNPVKLGLSYQIIGSTSLPPPTPIHHANGHGFFDHFCREKAGVIKRT